MDFHTFNDEHLRLLGKKVASVHKSKTFRSAVSVADHGNCAVAETAVIICISIPDGVLRNCCGAIQKCTEFVDLGSETLGPLNCIFYCVPCNL